MKGLMRLLKKKAEKGERISPEDKSAKLSVLDALDKMMDDEDADGMKKVTVMSPDKEGLAEGLEKAKEVIEKKADEDCEDEVCEIDDSESKEDQIARLKSELAELES